jgi:hypothetical protein
MARPASSHDFTLVTPPGHDETVEALEQRVRRLEDAVAALQDTQLMEDRVVERVRQRVELHHLEAPRSGLILSAARMLLPKPVEDVPPESPPADAEAPADGQSAAPPGPPSDASRPCWLVVDFYRELRAMVRMFADYRYRMSWSAKVVPLAAIVIALLSWLLISGIWFVGALTDRVIDLVLIVLVYKTMSRELQRYREMLARVTRYR